MAAKAEIPDYLPILPVDGRVLLPGSTMVLRVDDPRGMNMVESVFWSNDSWKGKCVGVVPRVHQQHEEKGGSGPLQLYSVGTAATVKQVNAQSHPRPHFSLVLLGVCRFKVKEFTRESPYPVAMVTQLDYLSNEDDETLSVDVKELANDLRVAASELVELLDVNSATADRLKRLLGHIPDQSLPDLLSSIVKGSFEEKLKVLDAVQLVQKLKATHPLVTRQVETLRLLQKASNVSVLPVEERKDRNKIRVRIRGGDNNRHIPVDDDSDISELEQRLRSAELPVHAQRAAEKELKRLKGMPQHFPEHSLTRNYLECLLDLPWSKQTDDAFDVARAREELEVDHYGMEKVKKRVLEFLAVRQLKQDMKGPILCFVGAPGVGKTSIGRSVAMTMGRKFHRISLGGVSDQSEIRGHRRTYIGAMPGRILQGLKTVGVCNPVFLLDEVDKLSRGIHGDPAAALLEVLDPEQNNSFVDHYLGVPFDLSKVLFIATANTMATIPPTLGDRMEVIEVPGYTQEDKLQIAKRHLVSKQLEANGLVLDQLEFSDSSLVRIISSYTREAGVRQLERTIGAVCRAAAVKIAEQLGKVALPSSTASEDVSPLGLPIQVTNDLLVDCLGPVRYEQELPKQLLVPGVALGLAWTAVGGETMCVEACKMPGEGKLVLTGQLGDVMKESAQIGLNWVRANAAKYGIVCGPLDKTDIHIHFPAGGVSKDGPSAGVTIVTVLASIFSGICVTANLAMTGEMTLRGVVLPVGGIKEKVLAAHRAGIRRVLLPKRNEKDLCELSGPVKDEMKFILVSTVEEVLNTAFAGKLRVASRL